MSDTQPIRRAALLLTETRPGSDAEAAEMVKLYNLLVGWVADQTPPEPVRTNKMVVGHVYFIQAAGGGPIKIGFSAQPTSRMRALRIGAPVRLALLATCPGGYDDERNLHVMFESAHVRGEWFRASAELLSLIESIKSGGGLPWAHDPKSESPQSRNPANSGADIRT